MAAQKDAAPLSIETAVPLYQLAREQLKEAELELTPAGTGTGAEPSSLVDELRAEIDALRHELSEARAQREAATAIAAAKVVAAELAEARKGWLERLLEALRRRS